MRTWLGTVLVAAVVAFGVVPAAAQEPASTPWGQAAPDSGPNIPPIQIHALHDGSGNWVLSQSYLRPDQRMIEYVPLGEGITDWHNRIAIRSQAIPPGVSLTASAYRDSQASAMQRTCAQADIDTYTHESPINGVQYVMQSACFQNDQRIGSSSPEYPVDVTIRRTIIVGSIAFVVQRNWRGDRSEWNAYERDHPQYADEWNAELDHVSICDLGDPDLVCPALGIFPVGALDELLAQAASERDPVEIVPGLEQWADSIRSGPEPGTIEYERLLRQRFLGFVRVRPIDESMIEAPAFSLNYTVPDTEWHELAGLRGLAQQLLSAASENHRAEVNAIYMPRAPEDWSERVADRVEVGNYLIQLYLLVARTDARVRQDHPELPRLKFEIVMTDWR